jgi:hypothetical protein
MNFTLDFLAQIANSTGETHDEQICRDPRRTGLAQLLGGAGWPVHAVQIRPDSATRRLTFSAILVRLRRTHLASVGVERPQH